MTPEELNFDLFTKMDREMTEFVAWLYHGRFFISS